MSRGYCLVPKRIIDNNLEIKYMYREQPDSKDDSGWRFFEGNESDDFVNNSDNIGLYDIETILEKDSSIPGYIVDIEENASFEKVDGEWKYINEDTTPENERVYFKDKISERYIDYNGNLIEIVLPWTGEKFYIIKNHYPLPLYTPYPMNWVSVSLPSICHIKGYFTKNELEDYYERVKIKEKESEIKINKWRKKRNEELKIIENKMETLYKQLLLVPNMYSKTGVYTHIVTEINFDYYQINFSIEKNMYCITKYKEKGAFHRAEKDVDISFEKYYSEKAEDIINKVKEILDIK